jgi:hypothetical protein
MTRYHKPKGDIMSLQNCRKFKYVQGYNNLQGKRTFKSECSIPKKLHLKHLVAVLYDGMYNNSGDSRFWHRCCWRINSTGIVVPVDRVWHSRKFRCSDNNMLLVSNWPSRAMWPDVSTWLIKRPVTISDHKPNSFRQIDRLTLGSRPYGPDAPRP